MGDEIAENINQEADQEVQENLDGNVIFSSVGKESNSPSEAESHTVNETMNLNNQNMIQNITLESGLLFVVGVIVTISFMERIPAVMSIIRFVLWNLMRKTTQGHKNIWKTSCKKFFPSQSLALGA